jgi:hypothetical protein
VVNGIRAIAVFQFRTGALVAGPVHTSANP